MGILNRKKPEYVKDVKYIKDGMTFAIPGMGAFVKVGEAAFKVNFADKIDFNLVQSEDIDFIFKRDGHVLTERDIETNLGGADE